MDRALRSFVFAIIAAIGPGLPVMGQVTVDPDLPDYKAVQGVSGTIKSVGSDTMNNLMTRWTEGFREFYPAVKVEVEGKGTNTAPPALIASSATFGTMSRDWKKEELSEFEAKFGYKPVVVPTSIDMLAVFVHKDNPLRSLTLAEIDAVFSQTRKLGFASDLTNWGQVGLEGDWERQRISLYGRNASSGTYLYFKDHALGKGDFKTTVKEQPGSSAVIQGVANDKFGIGYSGIGYRTADVRPLALAAKADGPAVEAEPDNAYSGKYPLSRLLYLSLNVRPNSELDPLRREFIRFVLSKQGQEVVVQDGYLPLPAKTAKKGLGLIGIK